MNRLNELAGLIDRGALAHGDRIELAALLRSAAKADGVGTHWAHHPDDGHAMTNLEADRRHNADVNAARIRIAAVEAERDDAIGALRDEVNLHKGISADRDAALTSLAERQRAIDKALRIYQLSSETSRTADATADRLTKHATSAAEAIPAHTEPVAENAYRVWECRVVVSADASLPGGFDYPPRRAVIDAITSRGIDIMLCSSGWGHTPTALELGMLGGKPQYPSDTRDNLPPLPNSSATLTGSPKPADDTRELVARLAECVRNLQPPAGKESTDGPTVG